MVKFLAWAVCVYLLLKLAHLVVRPATGYGGGAPALTDLLPAGEPNLLLFSLSFAALVTLYTNWWYHRLGSREYAHARGCYAQLETARRLFRGEAIDPYRIQNQADIYLWNGQKHGAWIGVSRDGARQDFERALNVYFNRYTAASAPAAPRITPALLHALDRCFADDWPAHGDFLNP